MAKQEKKKSKSTGIFVVLGIILCLCLFIAFKVFGPNTGTFTRGDYLYVHTGASYDQLKQSLVEGGFVSDMFSFNILANQAKLSAHVHAGKYKIPPTMSNYKLIRMLHSGRQTPVKLVINKLRTKQDFIRLLSTNLEADSASLTTMLSDPDYLDHFGLDTNTAMCAIMPDTYDFFWNVNADKAFRKIQKNYTRFWDSKRRDAAKNLGLDPVKVIIVASIVDEETNLNDDKPLVASVYLNRLKKGMKLQADPTVKFGIGDFTIRRINGEMLKNNSPYNTYMYEGLPPGPICTPAVSSIEAVLQSPKTNFLYFCAKEDFSGHSNFAVTFEDQMKNARAYQKALDARGIH